MLYINQGKDFLASLFSSVILDDRNDMFSIIRTFPKITHWVQCISKQNESVHELLIFCHLTPWLKGIVDVSQNVNPLLLS